MPRLPILSRSIYYTRLPNNGGMRFLPFALVNTSIGALVESRSYARTMPGYASEDVYDTSFTEISELSADRMYAVLGVNGDDMFLSYAR